MQAAQRIGHPLSLTLLALTFTTGMVDAGSYLGLGHVFTANMTGNVVLLGFGIAGAGGLPVVAPLVSMGGFVLGAVAGGVLAGRLAHRHPLHIGTALVIEGTLIGAAAVIAATGNPKPLAASGDLLIALLALAMGVRNATVRRIGVPDLTTTVLTLTLTGLAADSRLAGGAGKGTTRRTAAVVAMLFGALSGALLEKTSLALPLAFAAAIAFASCAAYVPVSRHGQTSTPPDAAG
jgi:uncharacterized membrane protein YoaK (UPF0700 family)